jgi:hypothetical protein
MKNCYNLNSTKKDIFIVGVSIIMYMNILFILLILYLRNFN